MTVSRLQGLDNSAMRSVVSAAQALDLGRVGDAEIQLAPVLSNYPDHPEVLRLHADVLSQRGNLATAVSTMRRVLKLRQEDPYCYNTLGLVLSRSHDYDGAIGALRRACELQPDFVTAWFNLGMMLTRCGRTEDAANAIGQAVQLDPGNSNARVLLANMLRMQGDTQASASEYRKVLNEFPYMGDAWWGLADLRTDELKDEDIQRIHAALRDRRATEEDRIAMGFALAKILDRLGRYRESLDALEGANNIARRRVRWNPSAFSRMISGFNTAFEGLPPSNRDSSLGEDVIFVVGMPRSGTTLAEQILSSHSRVEGAGELPDLPLVVAEESRRRGRPFPDWVAGMELVEWRRLGERYLERTAYWHRHKPMLVDKLPNNWMYIGAIRAMLPGAHIVVCRRTPLENCFSCYRQRFTNNEYTRTFHDLAAFWRDFDRTGTFWAGRCPSHVYEHSYDELLVDFSSEVRKLLDFCGLSFEQACLRFYQTKREIRSPSATQVRRHLQTDTARTVLYGGLLDPLRRELENL